MKLAIWKKKTKQDRPEPPKTLGGLLAGRTAGTPLRAGRLEMVPLFDSPERPDTFAPPESALQLARVRTYGHIVLKNESDRPTIAPMHIGHLQKGAQNHATCRAWVLPPHGEEEQKDACCIQAAQGGFISGADERFIVLPLPLRAKAFALRDKESYSKLWDDIGAHNSKLGLKRRGHLDELKQTHQPTLMRVAHRLEGLPQQTGALFYADGVLVGVELAPDAAYFAELLRPLVMYCYAPLTLGAELEGGEGPIELDTDGIEDTAHLARRLAALGEARRTRAKERLATLAMRSVETELGPQPYRYTLVDVDAGGLVGQAVLTTPTGAAYASLTSVM